MENIMLFYVILYTILGLIIYHSIFDIWYFNFGKALIGEILGALLFAALMTGLTLKFWLIALIIIILIGLILSAKVSSPMGKKIVIGVFVVVAIITAITGIRYNKQVKDQAKEEERQQQEAEEAVARYNTPTDPGVYLKESSDLDLISTGTTYVASKGNGYCFANVQYDSETKGIVDIQFFVESNGQIYKLDGYYEFQNNVDKPLTYVWNTDGQMKVKDAESFVVRGDAFDRDGFSGNYKLASESDVSYYEEHSQDQDYYFESDYGNYGDENSYEYSEYILPNSSVDVLTEDDLDGLSAQELTYARNEIYARHGYIFKSSELNEYFANQSWYEPDESFSGTLEGVEQQNATFISDYQKNNGMEYKVN